MKKLLAAALGAALVTLAFATARPVFPPWGVNLSFMDRAVAPGTDFFRYTNGSWLKTAVIPPDRAVAGVNLELDKGNEARLKSIVADLAARPDAALSIEERKLRDLYNAFEDTRAIEAQGLDERPGRAHTDRSLEDARRDRRIHGVPGQPGRRPV